MDARLLAMLAEIQAHIGHATLSGKALDALQPHAEDQHHAVTARYQAALHRLTDPDVQHALHDAYMTHLARGRDLGISGHPDL